MQAASLGIDAIGVNFYPKSKRYTDPLKASTFLNLLPSSLLKVGVFVNENATQLINIATAAGLDALQLHGEEEMKEVEKLSGNAFKLIKAIALKPGFDLQLLENWLEVVDYLLLDFYSTDLKGGSGKEIAADLLTAIPTELFSKKIILAGGLTDKNVTNKIRTYKPFGVDTASGIESASAREKDHRLMASFVKAAREI